MTLCPKPDITRFTTLPGWVNDSVNPWVNDVVNRHRVAEGDAPTSTCVANYINDLLLRVVRTGNRWNELSEVSADVLDFAQVVLSLAGNCRVASIRGTHSNGNPDIDRALSLCGGEYLHDLLYDQVDRTLSHAFDYTANESLEWVEGNILEDFGISEVETSRDVVENWPHRRRGLRRFSFLGINAAAVTALQELTTQYRDFPLDESRVLSAEELFGIMLGDFQPGRWPSMRYGLDLPNQVPKTELEKIMLRDDSPSDVQERLKSLLGNNGFLVSGTGNDAEFHFRVLIEGLAKAGTKETPIDVLQIEHAGQPDDPHPPVSLAVRVGSDWQVFYYIDAVGRMKSRIWSFLAGMGDRVAITPIKGVKTGFLLSLCDRPFQYVSRQWKSQKDLNSHLRGVIPELLASLLLVRLGYFPVRPSLTLRDKMELDAVGYKESAEGGECKIVEVKKPSTNRIELQKEIKAFVGKIQAIQRHSAAVDEALGRPGSIDTVSGIFISMAEIGDLTDGASHASGPASRLFDTAGTRAEFKAFIDSLQQFEFWDYNRFKKELEAAELPDLPTRLLEGAKLTWMLQDTNLDEDFGEWDALQKAVEDDNWLWPDSSEALKDRLDDFLRG